MDTIHLKFQTEVTTPVATVWKWITSFEEISAEMWLYFRMTAPMGIKSFADIKIEPG